jgi:hypothetical protein
VSRRLPPLPSCASATTTTVTLERPIGMGVGVRARFFSLRGSSALRQRRFVSPSVKTLA